MNGKWKLTIHTYMGDMGSEADYTVTDGILTGTVTDSGNGAVAEVENGKFDGSAFSYQITIKTAVGEMTNELKGTVDGDKLSGTSTNPMGTFELDGERIG